MEKYYFYLRHGLWNVVSGLLKEDGPVDIQDKLFAEKLLLSAAEDPHSFCFASQIIKYPWQQSWLASFLLQNLKISGMDKSVLSLAEVEIMKKEAEFQSILNRLSEIVPGKHIIEELLHLYNLVIHAERENEPVPALSTEAHKFICDYFLQDPVTANTVLQHLLCVWCPHFKKTDDDLQNIYSQALELCIVELNQRTSRTRIEKSDTTDALSSKSTEDLCGLVLCILSIFKMSEEEENSFLENFFPSLLSLSESGVLPREQLFMSMVSRKRLKMAKMFMDLEDRNSERNSIVSNGESLEKVYRKLLNFDDSIEIEEMFLRVVKREKHWTEDFVEICGLLVIENKTDLAEKFLSNHLMKNLWPLVLLHIWKSFSDNDKLFPVIDFLIKKCKEVVSDPVFLSLCLAIEHQILVIQWCKKYEEKFSLNNKDFLELAREHSTLEVLRRTTNLENLEWNEARNLLLLSNKTVNLNSNKQNLESITNWEVTTFDGFCILRKVFAVLQASMEVEQLRKQINRF